MFGSTPRAAWGTSQWGAILPTPGANFSLDAVCSGDLDQIFSLDGVAALNDQEATVSLDGNVEATLDAVFALDAAPALLPPEIYAKLTTKPYLLVELELPAGPIRVAKKHRCALGRTFSARLIKGGKILRTIKRGSDDLRLELDDTTTNGASRFRDLFAANAPEGSLVSVWLGADGATDAEHVLVFEGKVEAVQGFSDTAVRIQVVRREQVEDVLLGKLVNDTDFPNAPPETISSMLPIVFGTLNTHAGLVVKTNAIGSTLFNVFVADTVLQLVDATEFPTAGQVNVGGELIDYTGKSGDTLTGLTRGAGGSSAADHPKGSEVAEVGVFQVKFASHGLGFMRRFKMLLPNGNLGDPVPQPTTIDPVNALATWDDGLPQIRDPDARPTYQRVHFKDVDAGNTAIDPTFAARESKRYEAFQVAQIGIANALVLLTNTEGLGQPGDISRVWIGALFDPETVSPVAIAEVAARQYTLLPFDDIPDEIARNDERTGDRIYDVPPPTLDVSAAFVSFSATPQEVEEPGVFVTAQRARNAVDKDDDTFAAFQFIGLGESLISGGGDVVLKWTQQEWEAAFPAGSSPKEIFIRALMGSTLVPFSSPWDVYLRLDGVEIPNTLLRCISLNPAGLSAGFIRDVEEFLLDVTNTFDPFLPSIPDGLGGVLEIWDRIDMVLHPVTGVSSGFWSAHEVSFQGVNEPPLPTITVTQDVRRSVSNYFEVTDQLNLVNGQKSWDSFGDVASLGRVTFRGFGATEPRILETFWVVEFTPFVQASSRVPFVAADVSGLVPDGNPVEISRELIQRAEPEGLGLDPTRIDQASYMTASASLVVDQVRADFALRVPTSAVALLSELAAQADSRETWENERHRIVRRPRADTLLTVARNLTCGDYLAAGPGVSRKGIGRSSVRLVANRITATWAVYSPTGQTSKTEEINDAVSQATNLGLREAVLQLTLLQDDTAAIFVAQRKLERISVPRWIVEVDVPVYGVAYREGDLVSGSDPEFTFQVGEIVEVNLDTNRLKRTRIQIAVWLK